ncbi:VCBS repeat-containing protein [Kiritimatiellaeota bacterium B1221]|nr:VCBS repeat-containing protein [Kiritimatiellaeota bacterium B1221]
MKLFKVCCLSLLIALVQSVTTARPLPSTSHPMLGDYNGPDGNWESPRTDFVTYEPETGGWFIKTLEDGLIVFAESWGFETAIPVPGDYNGDGLADLAVYDTETGSWFIKTVGSNQLLVFGSIWGDASMIPVPGDFDGDGQSDLAVYQPATGNWYIRTLDGRLLVFGDSWGDAGMVPVAGDYNGDGASDLAVFELDTGSWFIRALDGSLLAFAENWGAKGYYPVPEDYNNDGIWDLAVYYQTTGEWFIKTLGSNELLIFGQVWGDETMIPSSGDFDGDGFADKAVYNYETGTWYVRSMDGRAISFGNVWGIPSSTVPSQAYMHGEADELAAPALEELIGARGPGGGFIWKPISEGDHKLVVLLPASLTDGIRGAWIADAEGTLVETGRFSGDTHNGAREHYRFSQKGSGYGNDIYLVSYDRSGNIIHWPIPSGANRWDY